MVRRHRTVGNSGYRWQLMSILMRIIVATIFLTSFALTSTHYVMAQEPTVDQGGSKKFVDWGQQPGSY